MTEENIELLTKGDVANLLRVGLRTVDNLIKRKEIISYKIGRSVRFKKSDLVTFIDKSRKGEADLKQVSVNKPFGKL